MAQALSPAQPLARRRAAFRVRRGTVALHGALLAGSVVMVVPFLWMVTSAFKQPSEVIAVPPVWWPAEPTFENIVNVWTKVDFAGYFVNSLYVATVVTALVLTTSSLVGYVLAKFDFWGRDVIFTCVLATMMIPWPVLLIPSYQMVFWLGLLNTHWALILPAAFNAFGIFMMRQFMHSIPDELLDAARIDGAPEPLIYVRIVLPLLGPALGALGIFEFLWQWNSFLWPLIVLSKQEKFTLPIGLNQFTGEFYNDTPAIMAGASIAVVPVLVVFLLLQRHIIAGVALTGMKG
jgi:ABC-type glycerol-3-phosphate transport system permease component